MNESVGELLARLDAFDVQIPPEDLRELLQNVEIDLESMQPFLRFHPERYQRNLLRGGDAYHALLLCWRAGQRSPIHDHRGSNCAFRVLQGTATESVFERTDRGLVFPVHSRRLECGTICSSADSDVHQVSNLEPVENLVTLHVYSPPLHVMGQYSLMEETVAEFVDPVFEFSSGSGI